MLKRNIKIALRKLSRRKEFTFINIFGLLVGFTTSMFILLWVSDELSFDRFHKDLDQVQAIWCHYDYDNGNKATGSYLTASIKGALEEDYPEFEKVARTGYSPGLQLAHNDKSFKAEGIRTDEEFLQIFDFPVLYGELTDESLETDKDLIITESMAIKLFDKADVAGQTVKVDNSYDAIIRAVVMDPPSNSRFQFDYLASVEAFTSVQKWTMGWGNGVVENWVKVKEGVDLANLETKISDLFSRKSDFDERTIFLKPISELYLYSDYENNELVGGRIEYVRLFTIIAVFIMVIACINFINLSFAESFKRAREVGVRKVVGAGKQHLVGQFLQESALLVLGAFVLAVIALEVLLPSFNNLTGKAIEFELGSEISLWFAGLALVTILLSGLYPSIVLSRFHTISALKGKLDRKGAGGAGAYIRKGMVIFQFVVSGGLIFATLIISQQIDYIFNNERNVNKSNLIVLQNDDELIYKFETFRNELLASPSIEEVTAIGELPINVNSTSGDPVWEGKTGNEKINGFRMMMTEPGLIPTLGLELVEGRNFKRELKSDTAKVILNEAAIRGMEIEDPIGKRLSFWGMDAQIIGIVKDFHLNSVYQEIAPLIIINWTENTSNVMLRAKEGQQAEALAHAQKTYAEFMPGYVFDYQFMEDAHMNMYQNELMVKDLARIFGIIAVFISCLGLFGLTSINAQRNVKEIGVRKVLGATVTQILTRFSGKSLILPTIATLLMVPLAYYLMQGWLEGFQYHVSIEVWMMGIVVAVSLAIALITVSFIAWRAARMNPVNSLRNE